MLLHRIEIRSLSFPFHRLTHCVCLTIPLLENGSSVSHRFRSYSLVTAWRFEPVSTFIDILANRLEESFSFQYNPEPSISQIPNICTGYSSEPSSRLVQAFIFPNFRIRISDGLPGLLIEGSCGNHSFHENARISPGNFVTPSSYMLFNYIVHCRAIVQSCVSSITDSH